MKKLSIAFLIFFTVQKALSQPWVPLGSNEQTSSSITVTGALTFFTQLSTDGLPYLTYIDDVPAENTLGDFKVHAKKFNNGQWEFAGDAISPAFPGSDNFPVALDGNVPYVAYSEAFTPVEIQNKLSVKKLNSNTNKWEVVGQLGFSDGTATGTAIAADNGKIYVAYQDGSFDSKITVKKFDNANPANGWQQVGTPGFSSGFVLGISIVVDNGIPYVAYLDFTDNVPSVKKFNGTTWENVGTNSPSAGMKVVVPSLTFDSRHTPYIAFVDSTGAGRVRNLNAVNSWVTTGDQPFATGIDNTLSLAILHDVPFIAFGLNENGVTQVHVKRFNVALNAWPDVGNQPVTASPSVVNNIALTTNGSNKLFAFFRNLNGGVYAKTFDVGGVLPVSLTDFQVTQQSNRSLLQWVTASEQDNKLFEIEHSTDAVTFKKIGEVAAKVPANIQQNYTFVHSSPAGGINYYRLKQIDKNGNYAYSKIISITFDRERLSVITLYPNPVKDVLHVANLMEGQKDIIIRNIEGEIIKRLKTGSKSIDINVANLPSDAYSISVYGDKIIETKEFIK